jgi:hypothetical protein
VKLRLQRQMALAVTAQETGPGLKFEPYLARHFACVEAVGRLMPKRGVSSCNQTNQCTKARPRAFMNSFIFEI